MTVLLFAGSHARAAQFLIGRTSLGTSPVVSIASGESDLAVAVHPGVQPSSGERVLLQALESLATVDGDWPSPLSQRAVDTQTRHDLWVAEAMATGLMALPDPVPPRTRRHPRLVSSEPVKLPATREEIERYEDGTRKS